jgi:putative transposase
MPIFTANKELSRAVKSLDFYRHINRQVKLSRYLNLEIKEKSEVNNLLSKSPMHVDIICFCLMNNHFHLLLRQVTDNGITKFMTNFQNSYSRYFNLRHNRKGVLFEERFKSVLVETDEQLLHLSRYIHLNPYSAGMVKNISELENYFWSSYPEYLRRRKGFCKPETILNLLEPAPNHHSGRVEYNTPGVKDTAYKAFVNDQADYQKQLEKVKHLTLDNKF